MTHVEGTHLYLADGLKLIKRKSDNQLVGEGVDLGDNDTIDNYEEVEVTEEEANAFWQSIGMQDPRIIQQN